MGGDTVLEKGGVKGRNSPATLLDFLLQVDLQGRRVAPWTGTIALLFGIFRLQLDRGMGFPELPNFSYLASTCIRFHICPTISLTRNLSCQTAVHGGKTYKRKLMN